MSRILIVDDEPGILNALRRLLLHAPCAYGRVAYVLEVETFASAREALKRAQHQPFDLAISDYHMPEMSGIAFLSEFQAIQPDAERLILSGCADINILNRDIVNAAIYGFVPKPWNDYFLMSVIAQALNHRDLKLENRVLAAQARGPAAVTPVTTPQTSHNADAAPLENVEWAPDGSIILPSAAARD